MELMVSPVLCGGTFFTLLLQAAKQGLNERKKWGKSTEFTERDVFGALVKVAIPTYENPSDAENFKSVVSAYKSCNTSKSGRLPMHEQANVTTFSNRITSNYQASLSDMTALIETYIDFEGKGDWLTRALLGLVCEDKSINETDLMYIRQDGQAILKSDLHNFTDVNFSALVLGIWHFIVVNRADNSIGKATYDKWCKPGKTRNTREPFKSDIGRNITRSFNLFMPIQSDNGDAVVDEDPFTRYRKPFSEEPAPDPISGTTTQIINSPAVFFNSGANATQINNTGTLNMDRGTSHEK